MIFCELRIEGLSGIRSSPFWNVSIQSFQHLSNAFIDALAELAFPRRAIEAGRSRPN